jgi:sugar lactone lactonase YvrE
LQADGRLVIVDSKQGLLLHLEADGSLMTHADLNGLGRGWNDIVIDGRGNIYVNRIGFDMLAGEASARGLGPTVSKAQGIVRRAIDTARACDAPPVSLPRECR